MGAIQGALNQLVTTGLAAAAGAKHFKEQEAQTKIAQEQKELTSVYNYQTALSKYKEASLDVQTALDTQQKIETEESDIESGSKRLESDINLAQDARAKGQNVVETDSGQANLREFEDSIAVSGQQLNERRKQLEIQKGAFEQRLKEVIGRRNIATADLNLAKKQLPKGGNK